MARISPGGNPRGKKPGTKNGYTVSPAVIEQRRKAAGRPRGGSLAATPKETRDAHKAERIGRSMPLVVLSDWAARFRHDAALAKLIDREFANPTIDALALTNLMAQRMTAGESSALGGQALDRYGQPRRTQQDVTVHDMTPDVLTAAAEMADWDSPPEEAHARPAGSGHAGNGAAH